MLLRLTALPALAALCLVPAGCAAEGKGARDTVILATTTSVRDCGLLDEWIPMFQERYPYSVKVVAVGSGEALQMGREGECDVMLVHSPEEEERMVEEGFAVNRRPVMRNDFLIVGPAEDPAGVRAAAWPAEAVRKIASAGAGFVSRGDGSGTHVKELSLWDEAGISPSGPWYLESGKGMADTLRVASQKRAYTLTDRGTFLTMRGELELAVLYGGGESLYNLYHVMEVNPERWPDVNREGARAFSDFVTGEEAQDFLRGFGVEEYGEPLFFPLAPQAGAPRRFREGALAAGRRRGGASWPAVAGGQGPRTSMNGLRREEGRGNG